MKSNRKIEGCAMLSRVNNGIDRHFTQRAICSATRSALALLVAMPATLWAAQGQSEEEKVHELTHEPSIVELGVGDVSRSSAKFGEYNGLGKDGVFGIGNFMLHGGGEYDSQDARRWSFSAENLGLETRELNFDYANQGKYRLTFGYGELLHRI